MVAASNKPGTAVVAKNNQILTCHACWTRGWGSCKWGRQKRETMPPPASVLPVESRVRTSQAGYSTTCAKAYILRDDKCCEESDATRSFSVYGETVMNSGTAWMVSKTGNARTNVIVRRARATTVAVKRKYYIFWVCFCSLRYPACNSYAPYCHLWPVRLYNIFPRYLKNGEIFEKNYWT